MEAGTTLRRRWRAATVAALLTIAAVPALAACTADAETSTAGSDNASPAATVIQPGEPGEEAETLAPDASVAASEHNPADVSYVRMMIPHHAQAVRMGELARTRARDEQVTSIASRIADAQGAEILEMAAWLERRGIDAPTVEDLQGHRRHGDPSKAMMPGMLSPAEMDELAEARGHRFDVLYVRGMIAHHQGAVTMAEQVMDDGSDLRVSELATDVLASQRAEIDRMRTLLHGLRAR